MGSKLSNAQVAATPGAMSQGISNAFGDSAGPEDEARKRKLAEDAAALQQSKDAQSGNSVWGAMGMDAIGGLKAGASDAWDALKKKNGS